MSTGESMPPDTSPSGVEVSRRLWTLPNVLCFIRMGGAVVLLPIAWQGHKGLFLGLFLLLALTDWLDGKFAVLFNQRSVFGARLDSWADATLFAALLIGLPMMYGDVLLGELPWIVAAVGGYLISTAAGFWKYGRWPSYHTRAAKSCWFLTTFAMIALFMDWALWPLRFALAAITLTNIEAIAITLVSPVWRANVTSIYHAWRDRKDQGISGHGG